MSQTTQTARKQYRQYVLGMAVLGVLMLMGVVAMAWVRAPEQTNIISNVILICLGVLPMMLCSFILYAVLVAAIFGINTVERSGRRGLQGVSKQTRKVAEQAARTGHKMSRHSIDIGTRLSGLDHVFNHSDDEDTHESTTE